MFIFRGAHVGQQCLVWRFIHHLPNYTKWSRITSWQPCMSSIRNPFSGQLVADQLIFFKVYWAPKKKSLWLPPAPSWNFCGTFVKISRSANPSHQHFLGIWFLETRLLRLEFISWEFKNQHLAVPAASARMRVRTIILRCGKALLGSSDSTYERTGECPKTRNRELNQNQTEILQRPSRARPRAIGGGSPLQVIYSRPLADRIIILGFCLANICEF